MTNGHKGTIFLFGLLMFGGMTTKRPSPHGIIAKSVTMTYLGHAYIYLRLAGQPTATAAA